MISVIIPTANSAATLGATLESLIPAAVQGLVREVIVVDAGSTDATLKIADGYGATTMPGGALRPLRLNAGAQAARSPWLMFLNPGCVPDPGWEREAELLAGRINDGLRDPAAAVFRFAIDDIGIEPRLTERLAMWTSSLFGLAHAEQGLLIPKTLFAEIGGYKPLPILEDVDLARRIGRRRLQRLRTTAVTNATELRRGGYANCAIRYYGSLVLYTLNVPTGRIASWLAPAQSQAAQV